MAKFKIVECEKGFDAVQATINGIPWWHSEQHGYWPTREACKQWIEANFSDVVYVNDLFK